MRAIIALVFAVQVAADTYMHNMRGSNNRLNENNQNRDNANRLFDSQNNNQGGYNVGDTNTQNGQGVMEYYSSSILSIEWTNQHGGNNPNLNAAILLQYMCNDVTGQYDNSGLRDGTSTNRVNGDNADSGRHETASYYSDCNTRSRNKGLFLADQTLNGDTAIYTRQNTNGDQHGYECPEEREYYPYWHPSPWTDIAVITSDPSRCVYYSQHSQNVVPVNYCSDPQYNNAVDCATGGATWQAFAPKGVPAPECVELGWSRDNHLGNTVGGETLKYNWTIPGVALVGGLYPECVLRLRYNISTGDYDGWNTFANLNGAKSPVKENPTVNFGLSDRVVSVQLALNTDQYGRTFQDRSHKFRIVPRPAAAGAGMIYNLNVRGRRGNIVQTYPAVEYDFVPDRLVVSSMDWVHVQWTGSLNTPDGAGQGAGSTDRSNIVQILSPMHNYPIPMDQQSLFDRAVAENLATVGVGSTIDDELDNAPAYYNADLVKFGGSAGKAGAYIFMCSRNNNFTNRSQKGKVIVA